MARITLSGKTFNQPVIGEVVTKTEIYDRLQRAIAEMNAGLRLQRREMKTFRKVIGELDHSLETLEGYMHDYREKLAKIPISTLRRKSLRLAEIMTV